MARYSDIRSLAWEWASYLEERGHGVALEADDWSVLLSRNGQGIRYRWLLLCAKRPVRRLTAIEREGIERQLRKARRAGERVYVVLRFERPEGRLLVMPAARALEEARLKSTSGGIPWDW